MAKSKPRINRWVARISTIVKVREVLDKHPDWTNIKIANAIGCHNSIVCKERRRRREQDEAYELVSKKRSKLKPPCLNHLPELVSLTLNKERSAVVLRCLSYGQNAISQKDVESGFAAEWETEINTLRRFVSDGLASLILRDATRLS